MKLIEHDSFPFEFLSQLAERESWRKEIHRPIYHIHKWWAKRLGSVFRGILIGSALESGDLRRAFYERRTFGNLSVFDPFMGSGTTIGEAHKLGFVALGRDINPVAVETVRVALGPLDKAALQKALVEVLDSVGGQIAGLYKSKDSQGRECDVLYYFWVMQAPCPACARSVDLFPSYVVAGNAYPKRKPEVQLLCPSCSAIFPAPNRHDAARCCSCGTVFRPDLGPAKGARATCNCCGSTFSVINALGGGRPDYRLYGKLVLSSSGTKEYLPATDEDHSSYKECARVLAAELRTGRIDLPALMLEDGYNTRQALGYGFKTWRDFFNDRQLLALAWLRGAILRLEDESARRAMMVLFSGTLEFNNLFASYKGEGTGAVRHMFAHHILKPERVPIEANVWGTPKSSGSFTSLFKGRLVRAIEYRQAPTEVNGETEPSLVCSPAFSGRVEDGWPAGGDFMPRGIYLSCGDSARASLPEKSVDLVFTYHHSRGEGWQALAHAILGAGFAVVNAHPVKAEMSVAAPKSQAKEPIQIDIVLVCRKMGRAADARAVSHEAAVASARLKIQRMRDAGFALSQNDRKVIVFGQLLASLRDEPGVSQIEAIVAKELDGLEPPEVQPRVAA